ncbi:MAG: DUF3596 domain-containing protein, partial [Mariprofundaceae bacterium]
MGRGGSGVEIRGKRIRISFQYRGVRCRETLKLPPTKANLRYAAGLKAEIDRKIALGVFDYREYFPESKCAARFAPGSSGITVAERLNEWLESRKRDTAPSTWESYETAVRCHLIPHLGERKLRDLTTAHIRMMIASLGVSNKRINNILIPLRGMLGDAFADGIIERNPMDRIKNLKTRAREPAPFTAEEQRAILEAAREHRNVLQFGFWTGLRIGELIALRWSDIDLRSGIAHVRRNNVRGVEKETKTGAGD